MADLQFFECIHFDIVKAAAGRIMNRDLASQHLPSPDGGIDIAWVDFEAVATPATPALSAKTIVAPSTC